MKNAKHFVIFLGILASCFAVTYLAASSPYRPRSGNIVPEISIPLQPTEQQLAFEAYEELINRYMAASQQDMETLRLNIQETNRKIDVVIAKLENIERALKITPVQPAPAKNPNPPAPSPNTPPIPQNEPPVIERNL